MFKKIFVEEGIREHPRTQKILSGLSYHRKPVIIRKVEDVFGRVNKRHTEKNTNLFLFLGRKEGALIKVAPPAYGFKKEERHFYFIHGYNCIYDCRYCYLQGYFSSPDIVAFLNHEEIIAAMGDTLEKYPQERIWFHAGEYSDSLAFSPHAQEWGLYWEFFRRHPRAYLELRTKSNLLRPLEKVEPLSNTVISFSLNPPAIAREYERKTPPTHRRLEAMATLAERGFRLGIHLDPIIHTSNFEDQYSGLIDSIAHLPKESITYISLGTMRFNRNFFKQNPQHINLRNEEMITSFDKKTRYLRPLRLYMAGFVKEKLEKAGFTKEIIYYCMEEEPADLS